ncbi:MULTISPECIES: anti-sigma regulatory factor [unclassified Bacillus (in: firmicutes)]|jgi:serine/threonine-protein kinase RsbT|uniref:anti-sigma regulatory factor n=1 Tax=unclassified Bacillus (in: firmicutes) TaxID=185979 RepID=UPI001BEA658C|nr:MULTISPECIES: anti-sigma regulatory factor [unclassified Bacillus (in: firmicutes)]MBT2685570.1 anti-sigma regulatory factor [Bacillus sp. ISL-37]MBT2693789.1 anti-sigma regulatory factor [Bacillus sp. ISL-55]
MTEPIIININNEFDIVLARQKGREVSKNLQFGGVDQARITTAISELARNIYLYAGSGQITIDVLEENGRKGIQISAADNGPGINDIRMVLQDGFSTSGGLGAGLPGVKRLMDSFDIDSMPGTGTKITITKWAR